LFPYVNKGVPIFTRSLARIFLSFP